MPPVVSSGTGDDPEDSSRGVLRNHLGCVAFFRFVEELGEAHQVLPGSLKRYSVASHLELPLERC